MTIKTIEQRLNDIEDRVAIKTIVDTFANLADKKHFSALVQLLTETAQVDFYFGETLAGSWNTPKAFEEALVSFSGNFEANYHVNGQQMIEVIGDNATSELSCQVIQIASVAGRKMLTINGVTYKDTLVRRADGWKIAKRLSLFNWSDTTEMRDVA